jgi:hypothetical protein
MLALYRTGRQAGALATFRRLRDALDADLGIEPCPALRHLEAAILRQDPTLQPRPPTVGLAPASAPPARPGAVPAAAQPPLPAG